MLQVASDTVAAFCYHRPCLSEAPFYGWTKRDASYKFKGRGIKIRDKPIKTRNLVKKFRKIRKIIVTRCHVLMQ